MDEDPLQHRIYFLTFIDSHDMIFSQYRETCEFLLDYPKIGGDDVLSIMQKSISVFIGTNIPYVPLVLTTSNRTQLAHIGTQMMTVRPSARTRL